MSVSSTDKGLLTPENCAVVFVDHQPRRMSRVASIDGEEFLDHLVVLAQAARIFEVPIILTALEAPGGGGALMPPLLDLFPDHEPIVRSSLNAWDEPRFVDAVRKSARRNFAVAALWSETSLVFPVLQMLEEGYGVYAVVDACGGTSRIAHDAAIRRIEQAGGVSLTALQLLLEFQRDWARTAHAAEVAAVVEKHLARRSTRPPRNPTR